MRYFLLVFPILIGLKLHAQTNTFPTTGNVGIGTTSPTTKLNVNGDQLNNRISQSGGTYTEFAQRTWSGSAGILFSAYASDSYVDGGLYATGNTKYKFNASTFGSSSHGAKMIYSDHSSIHFYISPASTGVGTDVVWGIPVLSLNRGGHIGIGTASPEAELHINGSNELLKLSYSTHAGYITGAQNGVNHWYVGAGSSSNDNIQFCNYRNSNLDLYTNSLLRMTVLGSGNVGIGTSNPTEKLVVDGKILAEEVKVQNVPSSDYVFEPDYNLLTLHEVEAFIKENKHLPDIPSAAEFKENGIGLGEMDNMLLRKVEELVLYMIEMQKKYEDLQEKYEAVVNEMETNKYK